MSERDKNLSEEISSIVRSITFEKPATEVVDQLEYFLLKHLKEIVAESMKRSLRRDPSSNLLSAQDIIYTMKGTTTTNADHPKIKDKIAKSLLLCDIHDQYVKSNKMKTHMKGLENELQLKQDDDYSEEIEEEEKQ